MSSNPEIIQERHNFNLALGDTISEKNESLYVALMALRDKLGGKVERMIVSKAWWEDNWSQVWMEIVFKPVETEHLWDGTIKVATFHNTYDVCVSDYVDSDDKYWVAIICSEGIGRIVIEGLI